MDKYDLVVIGSGSGGEKSAVKGAYFGYRTAIVEKSTELGGTGVHTTILPSKILKESALYFSGKSDQGIWGVDRTLCKDTSVQDFMYRKNIVSNSLAEGVRENLERHGVLIYQGEASFLDPHTLQVKGERECTLSTKNILISTGSRPHRPESIPFDGVRVHDTSTILNITHFPQSICIVGSGASGCEYASIFSLMGVNFYLINHSDQVMPFLDKEIADALVDAMQDAGVTIINDVSVQDIVVPEDPEDPLHIGLSSDEKLNVEMFLYTVGRRGQTKGLHLDAAGIPVDMNDLIEVNTHYQTVVDNIYAIGECAGFSAMANTGSDQGRIAVAHMFGIGHLEALPEIFPYGIYTVPEVSFVGLTESEAKERDIEVLSGVARYSDMPRARIMGAQQGMMKIVFGKEDLVIYGVHIIGNLAAELIHYGVTLVENRKTITDVVNAVFNYPTFHDLYKYACYQGLTSLTQHKI